MQIKVMKYCLLSKNVKLLKVPPHFASFAINWQRWGRPLQERVSVHSDRHQNGRGITRSQSGTRLAEDAH